MNVRPSEVAVLVGAAIAIAVVILVTLHLLDRRADADAAGLAAHGHEQICIRVYDVRESGSPPQPDRGAHPVPSPG